jgi:uncharacterized cupin superfamily protein
VSAHPNLREPVFDEPREREGFRCSRARIGRQAGSERLGVSLWALPPGQAAYPYHWHYTEEELIIVLEGAPTLHTPDGTRRLAPGEVVAFRTGEQGGHQIANDTQEEVRFLAFSTQGEPDVVMYPESGKVGVFERLPQGGGLRKLFRLEDEVDYWEGEAPPTRP